MYFLSQIFDVSFMSLHVQKLAMVMFLVALSAPSHTIPVPYPGLSRVDSLAPTSLLQSDLLLSLLRHTLQLHMYLQLQLYL